MLLAAILLVFSAPQSANTVKTAPHSAVAASEISSDDSSLYQPLPSAPEPKVPADSEINSVVTPAPAAIEPASAPAAAKLTPAKPFLGRPYETPRQRKIWYALSFAGAGAATFDAWSTRRAISQGYGVEGNPMLRPFSHSGALYAATQ